MQVRVAATVMSAYYFLYLLLSTLNIFYKQTTPMTMTMTAATSVMATSNDDDKGGLRLSCPQVSQGSDPHMLDTPSPTYSHTSSPASTPKCSNSRYRPAGVLLCIVLISANYIYLKAFFHTLIYSTKIKAYCFISITYLKH